MEISETISLLQKKILKIFGFLILIRLGLYIPVPNVDLDIFSQVKRESFECMIQIDSFTKFVI
mgnify:CR=1 FL=1